MNGLINLEVKILALFQRLCQLEIKSQRNSNKYYDILVDLKKKLQQEENLLKTLNINNISPEKLQEGLNKAAEFDESVQIRILSRIADILIKDISEITGHKKPEINSKIMEEIEINISMFTVKFLADLIKNEQNVIIKNAIILNFYDLCYLQPRIGASLLEDSFEVQEEYFKSCYLLADFFKLDRNETQHFIDNYCAELLFREFEELFYKEKDDVSDNREVYLKLFSCNIKAILTMFSCEGFAKAKNAFLHMVEGQQLTSHPNYEYAVCLFEQFNKSQDKVATITFGKPL